MAQKPMPWFRMYGEFIVDPKVQMLSECDQRRFIMVLCLRCSNGDVTLHDSEVAFQLRISDEEWCATKAVLLSKNLIADDNKPTNWDKRQYVSDSSAPRVSAHRARKKQGCNVTSSSSNGAVTPPDTDTDTEVNTLAHSAGAESIAPKKRKSSKPKVLVPGSVEAERFELLWKAYPKKVERPAAEKAFLKAHINGDFDAVLAAVKAQAQSRQWLEDDGKYVPYLSRWLNNRRWEDQLPGTAGMFEKEDWI